MIYSKTNFVLFFFELGITRVSASSSIYPSEESLKQPNWINILIIVLLYYDGTCAALNKGRLVSVTLQCSYCPCIRVHVPYISIAFSQRVANTLRGAKIPLPHTSCLRVADLKHFNNDGDDDKIMR